MKAKILYAKSNRPYKLYKAVDVEISKNVRTPHIRVTFELDNVFGADYFQVQIPAARLKYLLKDKHFKSRSSE